MRRRAFLAVAAAAVAAAAVIVSPSIETHQPRRRIYGVYDGGYEWAYSATSQEEAMRMHVELNYTDAGVPLDEANDLSPLGAWPDEKVLSVGDAGPNGETLYLTAAEWAREEEGLVGSTCS